jgi:phospholipase/carboxylesterase
MPGRRSKRIGCDTRTRGGGPTQRERPRAGALSTTAPVFVPQGYEPAYAYPLVVWLPGAAAFDLGRVMARTSLRNFVAVQPAAADTSVAPGGVAAAVWRAIDDVRERFSIHPDRVYLVGQGRGGTEALRIACRHPESFGGAVSLGGEFPLDEGAFARIREVRRLPMLLCCRGDADAATARAVDRTLRLFHAAGAVLALRIYSGTSDLSRSILADVNRWIMEEICGPPPGRGERMTNEACGP